MNEQGAENALTREDLLERLHRAERLTTFAKIASSIAHELGTPLNVVSGRASMIASGEVTGPEVIANAKAIIEQANRMTATIKQVLAHARRIPADRTEIGVKTLLDQTISVVAPRAAENRVEIMLDPETEEISLTVDPLRILQVLTIFAFNAIDAMPKGGRLILGARRRDKPPGYTIHVKDQGPGIPKEDIPSLFKPFQPKEEAKGTGLGLAIAQGIVREHGGWIDVESEIGAGSTFKVCLP
jgi:two-component system, NtrC family, sensor kinase